MLKDEEPLAVKLKLSYFHSTSSFPLQYKTIAQRFDELVAQYPDYECYVFKAEGKRYTYATMKDEIDCLAASLLELGLKKGDRIAVSLLNSSENVVLSYVASKIGLIKVKLNPESVARELACNLNKVGCKCLIMTSSETALNTLKQAIPDLEEESCKSVPTLEHIIFTGSNQIISSSFRNTHSYNTLMSQGVKNRAQLETFSVDPELPLLIYLTSGSTGQPKAVVLTNFIVFNAIAIFRFFYGSYLLRHCAPTSMYHITTGMYGALLPSTNPGTVIIPALTVNPETILRAIDEEKCTSIIAPPALMHGIYTHADRHKYNLSSLQYITVSSAPMQSNFLRTLERELSPARVSQGYGLTECCFLTNGICAKQDDDRRHTSIGRCDPHMEVKIVDEDGRTLPIGSTGELWTRGYSVMPGYYNDREKTAEIITDSRWLQTGDLARMDEDGYLFFVGRKKEIIKRNGIIYPIEVETIILEHPNVDEVHVFAISGHNLDEVVCAFVKLKSGMKCEVDELKLFLRKNLVAHKVPEHIRFVDDFIRNAMGKVPKHRLAEEMMKILKN